jgi:hypothetical protein
LGLRVNAQLGRKDLTAANIEGALEQISCVPVLRTLRRQLEAGTVQYHEASLLTELLEQLSAHAVPYAGVSVPTADRRMRLADPTALSALLTPDLPLAQVPGSLCWLTFLRWVLGLALALGPIVSQWIVERIKAKMVSGDEKWLKIRGRWHYWFVVLDVPTELPVLAALLPSRSHWACRWVGRQLHGLTASPAGHHHGWATGLRISGAGGPACLVSLSSATGRDPLVEATFSDRRRDQRAQAGDEKGVADPG